MKRNILLNPGPATTTNTVKQALVVPDICPREEEFGALTQSVLKKIVKVVNGQSTHSTVIFAGSGTAGVEAALSSVVPENGKILITDIRLSGTTKKLLPSFHDVVTPFFVIDSEESAVILVLSASVYWYFKYALWIPS